MTFSEKQMIAVSPAHTAHRSNTSVLPLSTFGLYSLNRQYSLSGVSTVDIIMLSNCTVGIVTGAPHHAEKQANHRNYANFYDLH
jgi:hypothetical protein